jgi:hypothetical protein
VVTDCCFDGIEASHWMSLFDIRQKYADLLDSADAAKFIESLDRRKHERPEWPE